MNNNTQTVHGIDDPGALNVRCLPRADRRKFKSICAEQGVSMEQAVVQLIGMIIDGRLKVQFSATK